MIANHLPYPPFSGTPLRNYNLLKRISRENEVWLATFVQSQEEYDNVKHLLEFCQGIETAEVQPEGALSRPAEAFRYLLAGRPLELRHYYSEELVHKINYLVSKINFDVVEIIDSYMGLYLETLPTRMHAKTVLTFIDIVFSKCDRISRLEPKPGRRMRIWLYSRMMRRWEPIYAERFGRCVAVSESDRRLLLSKNPRLQIEVVPNGVDADKYQLLPYTNSSPALIFVGNMEYRPNIDAMSHFCQDIFPSIRAEIVGLEMWIVGINPPPEVQLLDCNSVHVTGRVNDVRPFYSRSTVCVIPLRAGGGTRLKILEAMALGRPVVSTSIGCEGLDVMDGKHLFIADNPKAFIEKTLRLLTDEGLRQSITAQARELVVSRYDWEVIARRLIQVYSELPK